MHLSCDFIDVAPSKEPFSQMLAISPIIYYTKSFYSRTVLMALRGKAARGRG
jgi:hypothetical protein